MTDENLSMWADKELHKCQASFNCVHDHGISKSKEKRESERKIDR